MSNYSNSATASSIAAEKWFLREKVSFDDDDASVHFAKTPEEYIMDSAKTPKACVTNVFRYLTNTVKFSAYHDEFTKRYWWGKREISDSIILDELVNVEIEFSKSFTKDKIYDAMKKLCDSNSRDSLRDYILSLSWDRRPRIDTAIADAFNISDSHEREWACEVSRILFIQGASRALNPGCQADHTPVLFGKQGTGKTTFTRQLVPNESWHLGGLSLGHQDDKRAMEQLRGKFIVEFGDLKGMKHSDVDYLKEFLTRTTDSYRPSYGRVTEDHSRRCIFIATTNRPEALRDDSGNRRFLPLEIKNHLNRSFITPRMRDLLWAEAAFRYQRGETSQVREQFVVQALERQGAAQEYDAWTGPVLEYLDMRNIESGIQMHEIAYGALGIEMSRLGMAEQKRLAAILRAAGLNNKKRVRTQGETVRVWSK